MPVIQDKVIWISADLQPSLLGKLRALLYKPPIVWLTVRDLAGNVMRYRLIPSISREGFIIAPLLTSNEEFARYIQGEGLRSPDLIQFDIPKGDESYWASGTVVLSSLTGAKMKASNQTKAIKESGVCNIEPIAAYSAHALQTGKMGSRSIAVAPPTSTIAFKVTSSMKHVRGSHGVIVAQPSRFSQDDCAEFSIEAKSASDGTTKQLYRRNMSPFFKSADKDPLSFSLDLSGFENCILQFKITPGSSVNQTNVMPYWADMIFYE